MCHRGNLQNWVTYSACSPSPPMLNLSPVTPLRHQQQKQSWIQTKAQTRKCLPNSMWRSITAPYSEGGTMNCWCSRSQPLLQQHPSQFLIWCDSRGGQHPASLTYFPPMHRLDSSLVFSVMLGTRGWTKATT